MMQALRNNTKPIFLITIFAFIVGFVFLEGQAMLGGGGLTEQTSVAIVNGTPIDYMTYSRQFATAQSQVQGSLTPRLRVQLEQSTYNELVDLVLLQQEAEALGLGTDTEEVLEVLRRQPPPEVAQSPLFMTNGQFDMSKYYQQLANPQFLDQMHAIYLQQLPIQKLNDMVSSVVKTTNAEALETLDSRAQRATLTFIRVSPTLFGPDPTSFSQEEVESYYREHASDYTPAETATLTYAYLPRTPSATDSLEISEVLESIYLELEAGESFDELLDIHSEAPRTMRGGEVGVFVGSDSPTMTPELRSALDTLAVGAYTRPFNDIYGYHIVQLDSTKTDDAGETTYRLKDIAMRVAVTGTTERYLESYIVGVNEDVKKSGDFQSVADTTANVRVFTTQPIDLTETRPFIDGNMPTFKEVVDFCHEADPGTVGPILEGPGGYYVYRLDRRGPGEARPLADVETLVRADMVRARGEAEARRLAEEIARRAKEGETLEAIAEGDSLLTADSTRPFSRAAAAGGIGKEPKIMGAAFAMEVGEIAGPFEDSRGQLFVIRLDELTDRVAATLDPLENPQMVADAIGEVQSMKRDLILTSFLEQLKREAKIRDLRPIKAGTL